MHTPLNIIVIEDHDVLREVTVEALQKSGFHVVGLDCAEALADRPVEQIDLMIIDLNLPGEDGFSLARRMRENQPDIGIIMLTARNLSADKINGYESGADIYITKPTSQQALTAAINALARRLRNADQGHFGLQLMLSSLTLSGPQSTVSLSAQEATLLSALARALGHELESWQLIELLGKSPENYGKSNLDVHISRLRKKLSQAGSADNAIRAIRGKGYRLCERLKISVNNP
ncbi:MAG: response regulator transcription factor [Gallionella sp.]|nr:response regulator transcription factor [Gallionella sp.]